MTQLELAQKHEIEKLQEKLELMKKLGTSNGFYKYYFAQLKHHNFNYECFAKVNDLYFTLFGVERYTSWDSFRNSLKNNSLKK
jgi:hypothetical protein